MARGRLRPRAIQLNFPSLHRGQVRVREEMKDDNILCAGRGWWKSSLGMRLALDAAMNKVAVGWYAHTSQPIMDVTNEGFKKVFGEEQWEEFYNKSDKILQVPGWGAIYFHSLEEPGNKVGPTYGRIICDEFGKWPRGVYNDVIAPIIFKSRGQILKIGTPNPADPFNDFWDQLNIDLEKNPNVMTWRIPTVGAKFQDDEIIRVPHPYENPAYSFEELVADWKKTTPASRKLWRINYLVEFLSGDGGQFENVDRVCNLECVENPELSGEYTLRGYIPNYLSWFQTGVDVAVLGDYTVISVIDRTTMKQVYFRRFLPKSNTSMGRWAQVYAAIERVSRLYPGTLNVDVTNLGSHIEETMLGQGVSINPVNFGGGSGKKVSMMDHLADLLEGQKVFFFNLDVIKKELQSIQRRHLANSIQIKAEGKGHDDIPVSLGLMVKDVAPTMLDGDGELWQIPTIQASPFADMIW